MSSNGLDSLAGTATPLHGFKRNACSGAFKSAEVESSYMRWAFSQSRSLQVTAAAVVAIIRLAFLIGIHRPVYAVVLSCVELASIGLFFAVLFFTNPRRALGQCCGASASNPRLDDARN